MGRTRLFQRQREHSSLHSYSMFPELWYIQMRKKEWLTWEMVKEVYGLVEAIAIAVGG
jgi:hypothetical protein